jgi:uncharacterized phage protein (TIGR02216 family)
MSLGLHHLRLAPDMFWRLSLPEWRALTASARRTAPLARAEFEDLMSRHPDHAHAQ